MEAAFEVWEDPSTEARFCFSHSDSAFTTGVLILKSDTELPKHNRPLAFENLLQVSGVSQVTLLNDEGIVEDSYDLRPGTILRMQKGQWYIHSNPFEEESITFFKAAGDITAVVQKIREVFTSIQPIPVDKEDTPTFP